MTDEAIFLEVLSDNVPILRDKSTDISLDQGLPNSMSIAISWRKRICSRGFLHHSPSRIAAIMFDCSGIELYSGLVAAWRGGLAIHQASGVEYLQRATSFSKSMAVVPASMVMACPVIIAAFSPSSHATRLPTSRGSMDFGRSCLVDM